MTDTFQIGQWVVADSRDADELLAVVQVEQLPFIGQIVQIETMPSLDTTREQAVSTMLVQLLSAKGEVARVPIHWLRRLEA